MTATARKKITPKDPDARARTGRPRTPTLWTHPGSGLDYLTVPGCCRLSGLVTKQIQDIEKKYPDAFVQLGGDEAKLGKVVLASKFVEILIDRTKNDHGRVKVHAETIDPDRLDPRPRKDWLDGTRVKLDLEIRAGRLIPVEEVEMEMARVMKDIARFIETMPDQMERRAGMNSDQLALLVRLCDEQRAVLYKTLVED